MFPVKLRGTCPLKVQQRKNGGGGDVPPRLPGAPMIKPPPLRFQRLTSPMALSFTFVTNENIYP